MLRLKNIRLADGSACPDIEVFDGKDTDDERDMQELTAIPGFFDSHIHGSFGYDVSDGKTDDIVSLAVKLPSFGVTGFLPTLMTMEEDKILRAAEATAEAIVKLEDLNSYYASIAGLRLEGPFLNPLKSGVQNPECFVSAESFARIIEKIEKNCPGLVKMIDIAPELDGAMDLVGELKDRYVISLAHSDCDYGKASEFFCSGGNSLTHALNAMRPCLKRNPGPLGAAFDNENSYVEVICDGVHVEPPVIRMLFSLFKDRIIVISDAMRAGGMPDGTYDLGGVFVRSAGGRTYYGPDGNLAGSVTNPAEEAERLCSFGVSKTAVIKALTETPRKRLNIRNCLNDTEDNADLIFVDSKLRLKCVISRGRLVSPYFML